MNIKALGLVAIVVLFIYLQVKKESDLGTLESTLKSYKESMMDGNYAKAAELIYPEVFDTVSKEHILEKIQKRKSSQMIITQLQLTPRLPITTYSEGVYTLVDYEEQKVIDLSVALKEDGSSLNEKELERLKRITLAFFRMDMKKGDHLYSDEGSFLINIKKSGTYIYIKEHHEGWRYIDTSFLRKKRLKEILHTDIINQEQEFIVNIEDSYILELFGAK